MADAIATPILVNALRSALGYTGAKGIANMNKKDEKKPILDDGLLSKSETTETKTEKKSTPRTLSKDELNTLMVMLGEGGLSTPELRQIEKTGYISEKALKKLSPEVIKNVEGLTGVSMAFPEPSKGSGTPPVTGTTVKKQTRTETPDGVVTEKTTTFDGNSGIKKTSKTEIPDDDLSDLFSNIDLSQLSPEDITEDNPYVKLTAERTGLLPETVVRLARAKLRTHESLRNGIVERKDKAKKAFDQANSIHGKTVEVDNSDVMPSHMTKAEQNLERHAGQERLARTILRNEEKAKESLLHKDGLD